LAAFLLICLLAAKGVRSKFVLFAGTVMLIGAAALFLGTRASFDRLANQESEGRESTHTTCLRIATDRSIMSNIIGDGYGTWWPWPITEADSINVWDTVYVSTPYGRLAYHPHSTLLLLVIELGLPSVFLLVVIFRALLTSVILNRRSVLNASLLASAVSMFIETILFRYHILDFLWWVVVMAAFAMDSDVRMAVRSRLQRQTAPPRRAPLVAVESVPNL